MTITIEDVLYQIDSLQDLLKTFPLADEEKVFIERLRSQLLYEFDICEDSSIMDIFLLED